MAVSMGAIAVVTFNVGVFILLLQVLKVCLKLPRWFRNGRRYFDGRYEASQSLQDVPEQFDRLNQLIFNSNRKLNRLSERISITTQLTQFGNWLGRRRR